MEQFVITTIRASTPIILAAVAGLFSIRAGIFHLGIEGLMLASAFTAVAVGTTTQSIWLGLGAAIIVSLILSFIYWLLIDRLKADTVIAGLGLTTVSVGGTAFLMYSLLGVRGSLRSDVRLPQPVSGVQEGLLAYVSGLSILAWLTPLIVFLIWLLLKRSRFGLHIRAVGEYPYGAEAIGISQSKTRLYAILLTGVGCALAGAELSVGSLANFTENMTNGRGFIALAAMLFGAQHPISTALAGLFFGLTDAIGVVSQLHANSSIPRQFILMLPFVTTIVVVTLSSALIARRKKT